MESNVLEHRYIESIKQLIICRNGDEDWVKMETFIKSQNWSSYKTEEEAHAYVSNGDLGAGVTTYV